MKAWGVWLKSRITILGTGLKSWSASRIGRFILATYSIEFVLMWWKRKKSVLLPEIVPWLSSL
jgi:hypothetical protein